MSWLKDTEKQLDDLNSEATVNDPDKIKQRLNKHREFQKALAAKQPVYDQTMKTGKNLKDKAPKGDEPTLKNMLTDLKSKWTTVCSKAVDRYVFVNVRQLRNKLAVQFSAEIPLDCSYSTVI